MQVQDSAPRLLLVGHFRFLIKVPRAEPVSDRCALRPLYCTVGLLYGQCFSGVLGFASNPPRGRSARGFAALLGTIVKVLTGASGLAPAAPAARWSPGAPGCGGPRYGDRFEDLPAGV